VVEKSGVHTGHLETPITDQPLLSERTTVPIPMKFVTTHAYILSRVVSSRLLLLSEKGILSLGRNGLGKRRCYYISLLAKP